MHPTSLEDRAKALMVTLTTGIDDYYGRGSMSAAVYDTAWVSLISKSENGGTARWLFPECFECVLAQQQADGSFVSYSSQIDGILNTGASLLSFKRHAKTPDQLGSISTADLDDRIDRATKALASLLESWDIGSTIHVGFEILVPALLEYLEDEGIRFEFPGREQLFAVNAKKLAKFKPEYLYMKIQTTALHSLEAFIGKLDFNKVAHHKVRGSLMCSPSSTAAYLMNIATWDDDSEAYLRHTLSHGAGKGSGGMPSAFPSPIFELTWVASTLMEGDISLASVAPEEAAKAVNYLSNAFEAEKGLLGFTPFVGADADDTAKTILTLNLLNHPTPAETLLYEFEDVKHFKTYQQERDPSFSANCNVLNALVHSQDPAKYTTQIEKTSAFLCTTFQDSGKTVRDKWNLSIFYPFMLMIQASTKLLQLWNSGSLPEIGEKLVKDVLPPILYHLSVSTLRSQNSNGSWGSKDSQEETAYAVLVLAYALKLPLVKDLDGEIHEAIQRGRAYLTNPTSTPELEYLWVEKVTYGSEVLAESYILAALNIGIPPLRHDSGLSVNAPVAENEEVAGAGKRDAPKSKLVNGTSRAAPVSEVNGAPATNGTTTNGTISPPLTVSAEGPGLLDQPAWSSENERVLLGPYDYLDQQPGKDMRTQFIKAFNVWLEVPADRLAVIAKVVRMLHTSSLLVDDIEDSSALRRGVPVAHSIFGVAQTFNSANYVYFLALREIQKLHSPRAMDVFTEELLNLHRGQGMDLFWRESLVCPSEAEYLEMVGNKTGGLFRLAVRLMEGESPHCHQRESCTRLVNLLGQIFQVRDDYMNLFSATYTQTKGLCEDLTEGKFSFPIIHSIRADSENHQLFNILKQKTTDERIKRYAVSIMEGTGTFAYTRDFNRSLSQEAGELVDQYERQGWGSGDNIRILLDKMSMD